MHVAIKRIGRDVRMVVGAVKSCSFPDCVQIALRVGLRPVEVGAVVRPATEWPGHCCREVAQVVSPFRWSRLVCVGPHHDRDSKIQGEILLYSTTVRLSGPDQLWWSSHRVGKHQVMRLRRRSETCIVPLSRLESNLNVILPSLLYDMLYLMRPSW